MSVTDSIEVMVLFESETDRLTDRQSRQHSAGGKKSEVIGK